MGLGILWVWFFHVFGSGFFWEEWLCFVLVFLLEQPGHAGESQSNTLTWVSLTLLVQFFLQLELWIVQKTCTVSACALLRGYSPSTQVTPDTLKVF